MLIESPLRLEAFRLCGGSLLFGGAKCKASFGGSLIRLGALGALSFTPKIDDFSHIKSQW